MSNNQQLVSVGRTDLHVKSRYVSNGRHMIVGSAVRNAAALTTHCTVAMAMLTMAML